MAERHGPYLNNTFLVEIDGISIAGFSRVELPGASSALVSYREGADRSGTRRLMGGVEDEPLVLERGVTQNQELFEWFSLVTDGKVEEARRSLAVVLLDEQHTEAARWTFTDAWPTRYEAPVLDAATNEVAIERVEIAHEGMQRE